MNTTFIKTPEDIEKTGIQVYAEELAKRLPEHDVNVTTPKMIEIQIGDKKIGGYISRLAWLLMGRVKGDVVHAPNIFQLHRKTDVLTVHDLEAINHPEEYGFGASLWSFFLRKIENLDAIVTPSRYIANQVINTELAKPEDVWVIPHGIDHNTFYPDSPDVPILPLKYEDDPKILIVGEIRNRKKLEDSLKKCSEIDAIIMRVGPGERYVDENLLRIILNRGGRYIDFGYVSRDKLRYLYTYADAVLYPSREEGFGFIPLEAAACGTPTIVRDIPVFDETLAELKVTWCPNIDLLIHQAGSIRPTDLIERANKFTWGRSVSSHMALWRMLD